MHRPGRNYIYTVCRTAAVVVELNEGERGMKKKESKNNFQIKFVSKTYTNEINIIPAH